ncbi:MAG TPA: hypothetical protein VGW37_16365 [Terriglobia bacterium]|nr:hypothetical protein [Terriglobia bacterium]
MSPLGTHDAQCPLLMSQKVPQSAQAESPKQVSQVSQTPVDWLIVPPQQSEATCALSPFGTQETQAPLVWSHAGLPEHVRQFPSLPQPKQLVEVAHRFVLGSR